MENMKIEDEKCKCDCHITGKSHSVANGDEYVPVSCCWSCPNCSLDIDRQYIIEHMERCSFNKEEKEYFGIKSKSIN